MPHYEFDEVRTNCMRAPKGETMSTEDGYYVEVAGVYLARGGLAYVCPQVKDGALIFDDGTQVSGTVVCEACDWKDTTKPEDTEAVIEVYHPDDLLWKRFLSDTKPVRENGAFIVYSSGSPGYRVTRLIVMGTVVVRDARPSDFRPKTKRLSYG